MGTVVIPAVTGSTYTLLGTLAAANVYLNGEFDYRKRWNASQPDDRSSALVFAYRYLMDLPWRADVDPETTQDIIDAGYLLAGTKVMNPGLMGGAGGGDSGRGPVQEVQDTTRRVRFQSTSRAEESRADPVSALPVQIQTKIRPYLARAGVGLVAPFVSGTDGESVASEEKKFTVQD